MLGFPDNKLDSHPLLDIIQKLEYHVLQIQPSIIYTHSRTDLNIDHQIVHDAIHCL